jgi:L-malate glycosyltransferase
MDLGMTTKHGMLIITDTYIGIPGGSERHLYNFCKGVSDQFEIDAYQLIPDQSPMLPDGIFEGKQHIRLNHRPITKLHSLKSIKLLLELIRLIYTKNIKLVVSYHEKADLYNFILKRIFGKKIISISSKRDMGFKLAGRLKNIMLHVTPKFDLITCPSISIKTMLIDEFKVIPDKIHVVNNGVEMQLYSEIVANEKALLKETLGLPTEHNLITVIGCLKEVKGHQYLIEAFSKFLPQAHNKWTLVMIGEGELEENLRTQAKTLAIEKNVIFTGYQTNIHDWLKVTDIVVSASLSEGLSNALIEACAAARPIIATDVGGNPEIVDDFINGILVSSKNADQLCKALLTLDGDPAMASAMGVQSKRKAEQHYSNSSMVNNLETVYWQALKPFLLQRNPHEITP